MSYLTVAVEIDHGKLVPKEPEKLPETSSGLLTILSSAVKEPRGASRIELPLIRCKAGSQKINPTPEELDASLWD